jgi:RNA polymerase sigma-70 factor (ECF subfamily)
VNAGLTEEINRVMNDLEGPLLGYAGRLLRSHDAAQDVVQDAFIRYLKYRQTKGEIATPKAWLYRVVHNLALDYIRKTRRSETLHEQAGEVMKQMETICPASSFSRRDAESAAWRLLDTLSTREQRIVILRVVEERSYKEIAEIMDLTVSNVGFILHTAMKKLARDLARDLA